MSDVDTAPAPAEPRWWQRRDAKRLFWMWLVILVVMESLSWLPAWLMGPSASQQMDDIKTTMTLFTAASSPVAALVIAFMIYSVMAWRYKGDEPPPDDAPGFTTNSPTVVLWVIGSALLTLFVFIWGLMKIAAVPGAGGLAALPADSPTPVEVTVTGNQWVWNFTYPGFPMNDAANAGEGPQGRFVQSEVLYLPAGVPINFEVTSNDVIHSFWVAELGIKVDANPGQITETAVLPTVPGTYALRCAELCGVLHAAMETQVQVVSPEEFAAWVKQRQAEVPIEPPMPEAEEGA